MLLRVVVAAGAGALVGACSDSTHTSGVVAGSVAMMSDDGGQDAQVTGCGGHVCGSIALLTDSGPDADVEASDAGAHDAATDAEASLPCGTGVCGSIIMPEGGDQ
jgi:hypothetical protein